MLLQDLLFLYTMIIVIIFELIGWERKYGHSILTINKSSFNAAYKLAYVSGHIWGRANLPTKTDESLSNWTWSISSEKILCTWLSPNNALVSENLTKMAFKKYGCRLKCKKNCSCKKENVLCLPIFKCRGKCDVLLLKIDTFLYAFVLFHELIFVYRELNLISTYFTDCIYLYR